MRTSRALVGVTLLLWVSGCADTQPVARSGSVPLPPIAVASFYDGSSAPDGISMALMGADPVARFPKGVHDATLGAVVRGNPSLYKAIFKGAVFAFANQADLAAFTADPARFIPEVGGYCARAMGLRRITPGDPRNVLFVSEEDSGGMWAIFGRPEGATAWAGLASDKRREAVEAARIYYRDRTEPQIPSAAASRN